MFFSDVLLLNILSLFAATVLSWYFGEVELSFSPDKLLASLVSYSEKSLFRDGSFREGLYALIMCSVVVLGSSHIFFLFVKDAGGFWYSVISVFIIYSCISKRFSRFKEDQNTAVNYMGYSLPVILYTLLLGPVGALLFRLLAIFSHMNPARIERYGEYGQPAQKTYMVLRDLANLFIPVFKFIAEKLKKVMRFLRSFRP